jgi:hypothetical protein
MSKINKVGIMEQISKGNFHKFEATSRKQFDELMESLDKMRTELMYKEIPDKTKGIKKKLTWKK